MDPGLSPGALTVVRDRGKTDRHACYLASCYLGGLFSQLDATSQLTFVIGFPWNVKPSVGPNFLSVVFVISSSVPWTVNTGVVYGRFCFCSVPYVPCVPWVPFVLLMLFILPSFSDG